MGPSITFEAWKSQLRKDCVALNKLPAFDGLSEAVLRILYENGVDPSVQSIVANGLAGKKSSASVAKP
jgi:hypothetical protein